MADIDYDKIPDKDLLAIKQGKWDNVSDSTLLMLKGQTTAPPPTPETAPEPSLIDAIKDGWMSLPQSLPRWGKNMAGVITNPMGVLQGARDVAMGGLNKVIPGVAAAGQPEAWDAFKQNLNQNYGSWPNFKNYLSTDLPSAMTDVGSALSGAGGLMRAGGMSTAGELAARGGQMIDPLNLMAKGVSAATYPVRQGAKGTMGMFTGSGLGTVDQVLADSGNPRMLKYMRGQAGGEQLVGDMNSALGRVQEMRRTDYQDQLANMQKANIPIDPTPLVNEAKLLESAYQIKRDPNLVTSQASPAATGVQEGNPLGLNFYGSKLDGSPSQYGGPITGDAAAVKKILETIQYWPNNTAVGLDLLKQRLGASYQTVRGTNAEPFATRLENTTKELVAGAVPEYKEMLGKYEAASDLIKQVNDALSVGGRKGTDGAIRRLQTAMKDNYDFRQDVLQKLEDEVGGDLMSKLAGYNMRAPVLTGFRGASVEAGSIFSAILGANPKILALPLLATPRVVGEFLNVVGNMYKTFQAGKTLFPTGVRQGAFQAGKLQQYGPPQMTQ